MIEIRYAVESDFNFIYRLSAKNSNLLGFVHPIEIRKSIEDKKIIITLIDNQPGAFCIFNPLKRLSNQLTVSVICVDDIYRGNHIATKMITFLMKTYNRNIKAICIKDSDSEKFWQRIAKKYEELPGNKRPICKYIIYNDSNKLF